MRSYKAGHADIFVTRVVFARRHSITAPVIAHCLPITEIIFTMFTMWQFLLKYATGNVLYRDYFKVWSKRL